MNTENTTVHQQEAGPPAGLAGHERETVEGIAEDLLPEPQDNIDPWTRYTGGEGGEGTSVEGNPDGVRLVVQECDGQSGEDGPDCKQESGEDKSSWDTEMLRVDGLLLTKMEFSLLRLLLPAVRLDDESGRAANLGAFLAVLSGVTGSPLGVVAPASPAAPDGEAIQTAREDEDA